MAVLSTDQINQRLQSHDGWSYDGNVIAKEFKRADFVSSMMFVNGVALLAQAQDHHPDITLQWDTVRLTLATHSEGGITEKDFTLAAAVDTLG